MFGRNGKPNGAFHGASVPPPAPLATTAVTEPQQNNGNGTKALVLTGAQDIARFMPVMDIEQALARREVIVQATSQLMTVGVDFGKIPGAGDRDVLLQPGADKLCNLFGLVVEYEVTEAEEDWTGERHGGEPFFYYKVKGRAYRGEFLMGEGVGSCNSWESKYRWRKCERKCPSCGQEAIFKSKRPGEGYFCWKAKGGCGAQFPLGDQAIESQEVGRKLNPDPADVVNTILKMAYKRCKVATTINATSASEFFTQDMEDFQEADIPTIQRDASKIDTGGNRVGTQAAADHVAQQKLNKLQAADPTHPPSHIEDLSEWPAGTTDPWVKVKGILYYRGEDGNYARHTAPAPQPNAPAPPKPPVAAAPEPEPDLPQKRGEIAQAFAAVRERIGESRFFEELALAGVTDPLKFRDRKKANECYRRMVAIARMQKEAA